MSQLLDSLRANRGRRRPNPGGPTNSSRAALVINSLGLAPRRRRRISSPWLILAASLTAAIAAGSLMWRPAAADLADPSVAVRRASAFQQAGDFSRAVEIYEALLVRDQLPAQAHTNLGLIYRERGQLELAARELENALAHDPQYSRAHYNLAVLFDRSGDRTRAADHYRAFLEHRGSDQASLTTDVTARLAALDAAR